MTHSEFAKAARDWAVSKVGCAYSQAKRTQEKIFDCSSLVARAYSAQGNGFHVHPHCDIGDDILVQLESS